MTSAFTPTRTTPSSIDGLRWNNNGDLPVEIHAEQQKLLDADLIVLQFPGFGGQELLVILERLDRSRVHFWLRVRPTARPLIACCATAVAASSRVSVPSSLASAQVRQPVRSDRAASAAT